MKTDIILTSLLLILIIFINGCAQPKGELAFVTDTYTCKTDNSDNSCNLVSKNNFLILRKVSSNSYGANIMIKITNVGDGDLKNIHATMQCNEIIPGGLLPFEIKSGEDIQSQKLDKNYFFGFWGGDVLLDSDSAHAETVLLMRPNEETYLNMMLYYYGEFQWNCYANVYSEEPTQRIKSENFVINYNT